MSSSLPSYTPEYFDSGIFDTDYRSLALAIFETYQPKTVAEFGCGPGHLTRELAKLGVKVTAVDGYSNPDFANYSIEFHRLDLNNKSAIEEIFAGKYFDIAISMEVAEHLQPDASEALVYWMTKVATIVVFSAAVPGQGGQGHINLQPRDYWHRLFTANNFFIMDCIRQKLRHNPRIASWYRYNVVDYVYSPQPQASDLLEVISRLVASESAASTAYYEESTTMGVAQAQLSYTPVKSYLWLRRLAKRLMRRG